VRPFRKFAVFDKSHALVLETYRACADFPADERFGLMAQLRRAVVSLPTNLAEGAGRTTDADFARFVQIAIGSANEVEYLLLLARDLGYLDELIHARLEGATIEVRRMLISLARTLREQKAPAPVGRL
jgi:four helix bundle protein